MYDHVETVSAPNHTFSWASLTNLKPLCCVPTVMQSVTNAMIVSDLGIFLKFLAWICSDAGRYILIQFVAL